MPPVMKDKKQPLVRIDFADKAILDQLTAKTGESAPKLLHRAVVALKKEIFFESMNSSYRQLRENKEAWAEEKADRAIFDNASMDGIEL